MRTFFISILLAFFALVYADPSETGCLSEDLNHEEATIQDWINSAYYAVPFSGKNRDLVNELVKQDLQGKTETAKNSIVFFNQAKEPLSIEGSSTESSADLFNFNASTRPPIPFGSYSWWYLYKANFGIEKVYVRFPSTPSITQSSTMMVAFAYEYNVLYSLAAYYPPVGHIEPTLYFDNVLFNASQPPFMLLSHAIYQVDACCVLDYVMHDTFKNLLVKTRVIVTPFNAYTLQTVSTYGISSRFEYFIDSFKIKLNP